MNQIRSIFLSLPPSIKEIDNTKDGILKTALDPLKEGISPSSFKNFCRAFNKLLKKSIADPAIRKIITGTFNFFIDKGFVSILFKLIKGPSEEISQQAICFLNKINPEVPTVEFEREIISALLHFLGIPFSEFKKGNTEYNFTSYSKFQFSHTVFGLTISQLHSCLLLLCLCEDVFEDFSSNFLHIYFPFLMNLSSFLHSGLSVRNVYSQVCNNLSSSYPLAYINVKKKDIAKLDNNIPVLAQKFRTQKGLILVITCCISGCLKYPIDFISFSVVSKDLLPSFLSTVERTFEHMEILEEEKRKEREKKKNSEKMFPLESIDKFIHSASSNSAISPHFPNYLSLTDIPKGFEHVCREAMNAVYMFKDLFICFLKDNLSRIKKLPPSEMDVEFDGIRRMLGIKNEAGEWSDEKRVILLHLVTLVYVLSYKKKKLKEAMLTLVPDIRMLSYYLLNSSLSKKSLPLTFSFSSYSSPPNFYAVIKSQKTYLPDSLLRLEAELEKLKNDKRYKIYKLHVSKSLEEMRGEQSIYSDEMHVVIV